MPEMLLEEGYVMLVSDPYQHWLICHFCIIYSVHLLSMSSTCVFMYAMPSFQWYSPCIFVISVVISLKSLSAVILLPYKLDATERSMHILEMFSKDVL